MLAPTVGPGVAVAPLTHRGQVAEMVSATSRAVVGVPRSAQHRVAATARRMVRAPAHHALTISSGTIVKGLPGGLRYSHDQEPLGPESVSPTRLTALYSRRVEYESWCGRSDSNRHGVYALGKAPHPVPDRARLPSRHARQGGTQAGPYVPERLDRPRTAALSRWSQSSIGGGISSPFVLPHVWGWIGGPGRMLVRHYTASGRFFCSLMSHMHFATLPANLEYFAISSKARVPLARTVITRPGYPFANSSLNVFSAHASPLLVSVYRLPDRVPPFMKWPLCALGQMLPP